MTQTTKQETMKQEAMGTDAQHTQPKHSPCYHVGECGQLMANNTHSPMIIAEVGTAHGGSLEKAFELIDASCEAGADAVKMQCVYASEILHPLTGIVHLPSGDERLYDTFKALEVAPSFLAECSARAHSLGMQFIVSPFGTQSLRDVIDANVDAIKVASPELNHFPLLEAIAHYRKRQTEEGKEAVPIILSSGVSRLADIEAALDIVGVDGVTLLHCVTSYPAPPSDYNVRLIASLRCVFGVDCGISDHSTDSVLVPSLAVAMGGTMIEKHITLSKDDGGLDDKVALTPDEFALMTHAVHQAATMMAHYGQERGCGEVIKQLSAEYGESMVQDVLGDGVKRLAASEAENYGRTNRSLHYMRAMKKGQVIREGDISVLRTEKVLSAGLSPRYMATLMGATLARDVDDGAGAVWEDFLTMPC